MFHCIIVGYRFQNFPILEEALTHTSLIVRRHHLQQHGTHVISYHVTSYHIMSCHVLLCHVKPNVTINPIEHYSNSNFTTLVTKQKPKLT